MSVLPLQYHSSEHCFLRLLHTILSGTVIHVFLSLSLLILFISTLFKLQKLIPFFFLSLLFSPSSLAPVFWLPKLYLISFLFLFLSLFLLLLSTFFCLLYANSVLVLLFPLFPFISHSTFCLPWPSDLNCNFFFSLSFPLPFSVVYFF